MQKADCANAPCGLNIYQNPLAIVPELIHSPSSKILRSIPGVRRQNLKPSPPVSNAGRVAVAHVQGPPKGGGALW